MPRDTPTVGSITRAARVLDALAQKPDGAALADVVAHTSCTKTTAHRVLSALQLVRYVAQDPLDRSYRLGGALADVSRRARLADVAAMGRRTIQRLAELTGDTVFLSVPEGAEAVCVARAVGDYPIRTLTLDRGDRRPLGVGAGALALYCAMPPERRAAVNRVNAAWLREYGFDHARLEAAQAAFVRTGYAVNAGGVVPAMSAVGLPVHARSGRLVAALAVGAINERMSGDRQRDVVLPALRSEAERLADRLSAWDEEAA